MTVAKARVLHLTRWAGSCGSIVNVSCGIMVSIWWLIWAFVIGGYSGMLLLSLLLIARRATSPGESIAGGS